MPDPKRIDAQTAHTHVEREDALLVCAYADEKKCEKLAIGPSISYEEFRNRRDDLDKWREIILYCT